MFGSRSKKSKTTWQTPNEVRPLLGSKIRAGYRRDSKDGSYDREMRDKFARAGRSPGRDKHFAKPKAKWAPPSGAPKSTAKPLKKKVHW